MSDIDEAINCKCGTHPNVWRMWGTATRVICPNCNHQEKSVPDWNAWVNDLKTEEIVDDFCRHVNEFFDRLEKTKGNTDFFEREREYILGEYRRVSGIGNKNA